MNKPLGGKLVNRIVTGRERNTLLTRKLPSIIISQEKEIEVWNIATGAYSPLTGFLDKKDFQSVLADCRLKSGIFWPIPIILDIDSREKKLISGKNDVFLKNTAGHIVALLAVTDIYPFEKALFAKKIFRTTDKSHPGVARLKRRKPYLVGGDITWLGKTAPTSFKPSYTPVETRKMFQEKHWNRIVAFHTRNVPHRGHEHVQREALKKVDGLFVNPLVGSKKDGDFKNEVVAKVYAYFVAKVLPRGKAILSFLPYSAYYAGPREAMLTAVIRKNFGCTDFIVGRDHTGVGDFYARNDYVKAFEKYERAMRIRIFHFGKAFYCLECKGTAFEDTCPHPEKYRIHPSGTIVRKMLLERKAPPVEMLRPEISRILLKEKNLFV